MNIFEMAKKNYDRKTWTIEMLEALVAKGKLTPDEYGQITGYEYESGE